MSTLIKRLVWELTAPSADPDSPPQRVLLKYLSNSDTVDKVYAFLAERLQAQLLFASSLQSVESNPIVTNCFEILKPNLLIYRPSPAIRSMLDQLLNLIYNKFKESSEEGRFLKSVLYVRSTLAVQGGSEQDKGQKTLFDFSGNAEWEESISKVEHLLKSRCKPIPGTRGELVPSILLYWTFFGGLFRKIRKVGQSEIDIAGAVPLYVPLAGERVKRVAIAKNRDEKNKYRESGHLGVRPKLTILPTYKFYEEQSPLKPDREDIDLIFRSLIRPDGGNLYTRQLASKLWVKLVLDMYLAGDDLDVLLPFFEDCVSVKLPVETRLHAFGLLYNLSIHALMLSADSVNESAGKSKTDIFINKLREFCVKILLQLVTQGEQDRRVWAAGWKCYVHLHSQNGLLKGEDLSLNVVVATLDRVPNLDCTSYNALIRLMVGKVYDSETGLLRKSAVKSAGGIATIVRLYRDSPSSVGELYLFTIIFDYLVSDLKGFDTPEMGGARERLYQLLIHFRSPHLLRVVFQYTPPKFVEDFVRFVFFDQVHRDSALHKFSSTIDKNLIVAFLYGLEKLAKGSGALHTSLVEVADAAMAPGSRSLPRALNLVRSLVTSAVSSDRLDGVSLLFQLFRHFSSSEERASSQEYVSVQRAIASIVKDERADVRACYIEITKRILYYERANVVQHFDGRATGTLSLLNQHVTVLIRVGEKDVVNILRLALTMLDIIGVCLQSRQMVESQYDSEHQSAYVEHDACVPPYVVEQLSGDVLLFMVRMIPTGAFAEIRIAFLRLLLARLSEFDDSLSVLQQLGGLNLCRRLVADRDPLVSSLASQFVLDFLLKNFPQKYRQKLGELVQGAQAARDSEVLQNSYLQAKKILEMWE